MPYPNEFDEKLVLKYFEKPLYGTSEKYILAMTATQVRDEIVELTGHTHLSENTVGRILARDGFRKRTVREGKDTTKLWLLSRCNRDKVEKVKFGIKVISPERQILETRIMDKFMPCEWSDGRAIVLSTKEIAEEIDQYASINYIGRILSNMGFKKRTVRLDNFTTMKKWKVIRLGNVVFG